MTDPAADPFGPDGDNRVPGEIVVTLSSAANQAASTATTAATESGGGSSGPTTIGVSSIDGVLASLQPNAIDRVHEDLDVVSATASGGDQGGDPNAALTSEMDAAYVVRFNPEIDPATVISQLGALPEVVDVQPNYYLSTTFIPNDADWAQQWGPLKIHCPDAWDTATGSPGVIVAIVDSGVDLNHPDLAGQLLPGRNFVNVTGTPPLGHHFEGRLTNPDNNPQDEVGHGTHVAGIVGALGNNGQGVAGVVWQCKLLPVRVMYRDINDTTHQSGGSGTSANIASGIRWAASQGAKIINLSLGHYAPNDKILADGVRFAQNLGVLVVAAMGNDHTAKPMYPAALPGVFAVGSIDQSDQRSAFGNFGPHMAVCAPGDGIHSTYFDYQTGSSTYADLSGTSMATPHVAGVAALIWSADTTRTSADIATALRSSARTLPVVDPTQYGSGCVDCLGALHVIVPPPAVISGPDPENNPNPPTTVVASGDGTGTTPTDGTGTTPTDGAPTDGTTTEPAGGDSSETTVASSDPAPVPDPDPFAVASG